MCTPPFDNTVSIAALFQVVAGLDETVVDITGAGVVDLCWAVVAAKFIGGDVYFAHSMDVEGGMLILRLNRIAWIFWFFLRCLLAM